MEEHVPGAATKDAAPTRSRTRSRLGQLAPSSRPGLYCFQRPALSWQPWAARACWRPRTITSHGSDQTPLLSQIRRPGPAPSVPLVPESVTIYWRELPWTLWIAQHRCLKAQTGAATLQQQRPNGTPNLHADTFSKARRLCIDGCIAAIAQTCTSLARSLTTNVNLAYWLKRFSHAAGSDTRQSAWGHPRPTTINSHTPFPFQVQLEQQSHHRRSQPSRRAFGSAARPQISCW